MKHKFTNALSLALIVAMLFTSVALADTITTDGDALTTSPNVALTSCVANIELNGSARINYQGSSHFASAGGTLNVTYTVDAPVNVDGPATLNLLSGWDSSADVFSFGFTTKVPAGISNGTYKVNVEVSGPKQGGGSLTVEDFFNINVNCPTAPVDNTAPTASPTQSPPANANGWNNSDVIVNWNWADNTGGSGIDSANCTTSSTSSGEGEITLNATCKDIAGNTGTSSYTVKVDKSGPIVSASGNPVKNSYGWNNTDVTVSYTCSDNGPSGIDAAASDLGDDILSASGEASGTCVDLAGNSASASYNASIDKDAPTASATAVPSANGYGWNNTTVTVSYSGNDGSGSGIDFCDAADVFTAEGAGQSASGTCTDKAGNVSAPATATINIDLTNPLVSLFGGPADGGTYYFGFVPAAPTCSASDALSGLNAPCSVAGYNAAIGEHTVTASASDKAGNSATDSASYTVSAWTLSGFYAPVDRGIHNTVKAGATVPLKFEVFAGPTELTSTDVVLYFTQTRVQCDGSLPEDAVEITSTGATTLRYDTTAGQFIQNWQTPRQAGTCYLVKMTTDDGSFLTALFKLK